MKKKTLITNIQRFSLHDGPGIRTTVFCKGCSMRCPWCANPENLEARPETYVKDGRSGVYGQFLSCDELYNEVMKDEIFYRQGGNGADSNAMSGSGSGLETVSVRGSRIRLDSMPGGVTYSGGEALLQADSLEPLFQRLKAAGVHQCVETCLFVPAGRLEIALRYLDLFYVDIKILDGEQCKRILHGDLEQYLANLETLFEANKPVVFRVPVIGGYTDGEENMKAVIELIRQKPPLKVELIREHNLGQSKYISLGKEPLDLHTVTDESMEQYKSEIGKAVDIPVEICKV